MILKETKKNVSNDMRNILTMNNVSYLRIMAKQSTKTF